MIDFLSSWAKSLGVAIVAVSILEMLLPNNKTKKYVKTVMGMYIIFNIIFPFIKNKEIFDIKNIDLENYETIQTNSNIDQSSMNKRIEELYKQELEKDITKKINEKGYDVDKCEVKVQIADNDEETKINKIILKIKKNENKDSRSDDANSQNEIENRIVSEVQKIKPIDTKIGSNKNEEKSNNSESNKQVSRSDIQNIKKFIIDEYGVNEKCLEIN